jgi:imidazolonepropionase-like amidohydrolase
MCIEADGPEGMRQAVRSLLKRRADWIKLMASGGALPGHTFETASAPQLTAEELRMAVEEGKRAGVRTAAHAVGSETIRLCVESGVATIEHGVGLTDATIDLLLERKTWLVPTLSVYRRSAMQAEQWQRSGATWAASRELYDLHMSVMGRAIEAEVNIAAGTDSIGDMVEEMQMLVELGMEPYQAVQCATINGARLMGIEDIVGTIEAGKQADLVLLEDNPLLNPGTYSRPILVVQDGQIVYTQEGGLQVEVHP